MPIFWEMYCQNIWQSLKITLYLFIWYSSTVEVRPRTHSCNVISLDKLNCVFVCVCWSISAISQLFAEFKPRWQGTVNKVRKSLSTCLSILLSTPLSYSVILIPKYNPRLFQPTNTRNCDFQILISQVLIYLPCHRNSDRSDPPRNHLGIHRHHQPPLVSSRCLWCRSCDWDWNETRLSETTHREISIVCSDSN